MAKKFYFSVFQHENHNGWTTREWAGDTHPFKLREDLIKRGDFRSAVILFFKEISKAEFVLFKKMQDQKRPGGN